jgi:N-acetylmuramic acid 6-phosphate etherase
MTYWIAFDAGATRTTAGLYSHNGRLLREAEGAPCNPAAYGIAASMTALIDLARRLNPPQNKPLAAAAGISGAGVPAIQQEIGQRLCEALRLERALVTTDLSPILYANAPNRAALLALAGTGAAVLAQNPAGQIKRFGGRGALFGDEGSAYAIAVSALRAAAHTTDGLGPQTTLTESLPHFAGLSAFEDMVAWSATASKKAVASLARVVSDAAMEGDAVALACLRDQARQLALLIHAAFEWIALSPKDILVFMHGGLFAHCPLYIDFFCDILQQTDALMALPAPIRGHRAVFSLSRHEAPKEWLRQTLYDANQSAQALAPAELCPSLPKPLDKMTACEIVAAMNTEDATVAQAVARQANAIATLIDMAAETLMAEGRLVYAGAGTSGRLGVLDASECPPTFGIDANRVCGLIAGGEAALRNSVEGAEDDRPLARKDIENLAVGPRDLVIGIAASANTPYTRAALETAAGKGARTALICCNPACASGADWIVALDTGPEVIPGSSRLKAGTATKMVLNMISTGAMARAGYLYEGLMVGMRPINAKLRRRAARIVADLTGLDEQQADALLSEAGDDIRVAVAMARRGWSRQTAENVLASTRGNLRAALEENL